LRTTLRVLYLTAPSPDPQGLTTFSFIEEEILALHRRGVDVFMLSPEFPSVRDVQGIHVHPIAPRGSFLDRLETARFMIANARAVPLRAGTLHPRQLVYNMRHESTAADLVRSQQIDLIHSHFGFPGGLGGRVAAAAAGVPVVATFRGMDLLVDEGLEHGLRREPFYDAVIRILLRHADRTTYVSEFMRGRGIGLGADPARTRTIPKGVDLDTFAPADAARAKHDLGLNGPVILSVCGLKKLKGVDTVLRALALIAPTHHFTFVVCGTGRERDALQRLASELGLRDRVQFRGTISRAEIPAYFAACDIFVLASRIEASGNVLLEAMASGRAVVCTDAGGPAEYVVDGQTAFVVPVDDSVAMADRFRLLLDDAPLRQRFGAAGRRRAERRFAYGRMVDDILLAYDEVLSSSDH
jgi:glycosyltransferase involved in cell wall biosynthesis